jgi:hypothetical protein
MAVFLNRRQLAERWNLKPGTLASWACQSPPRGPKPNRFGRAVRYSMESILAFEKATEANKTTKKRKGR